MKNKTKQKLSKMYKGISFEEKFGKEIAELVKQIGNIPWNKGIKINKEDYPYWGNTQKIEVYN
jgi:hypothetical protein